MRFLKTGYSSALSDEELIGSFRSHHKEEALSVLFDRYAHLVFGICMKYFRDEDASKDAAMEIFEKLSTDLLKHEVQNFKAWLCTVVKNHCLMDLRVQQVKQKRSAEIKREVELGMEWGLDLHQEKLALEKNIANLEKAIGKLNDEQKRCIELFYLQEKSYQQVAEITGYSMLQVKSYIQNGKRNLKIIMTRENESRTS